MNQNSKTTLTTWDKICTSRAKEIENGADETYNRIIVPYVLNVLNAYCNKEDSVIDIGSFCGFLTSKISDNYDVVGIDISRTAVEYAKGRYPHINFINDDICTTNLNEKYNFAIANLVVNNLPDLNGFLLKINELLYEDGKLLIIIPHPCYWAKEKIEDTSYLYETNKGYNYKFKTHNNFSYNNMITYYHRPLEMYINTFIQSGFSLLRFDEIYENWKEKNLCEIPHLLGMLIEPTRNSSEILNYPIGWNKI